MEKKFTKFLIILIGIIICPILLNAQGQIAGNVLYHGNSPIPNVTVKLHDVNGTIVGSTTTGTSGYYEFNNVLYGTYTVTFTDNNPAGGVNLTDAFLIMLHLFNMYPFSDVQHMAADVNGSGSVTWTDYFMVLISYLTQGQMFPIGPWVFETETVTVSASRDSFTTSVGSSTGDANGTFVPTKKGDVELECNYSNPMIFETSKEFTLPLYSDKSLEMSGMYLILDLPAELEFKGLTSETRGINYYVNGQQIRISWIDENLKGLRLGPNDPLISLRLVSKQAPTAGKTIQLTLDQSSHFIDGKGDIIPDVSLNMPALTYQPTNGNPIASQSVYPNPFVQFTNIVYELKDPGIIHIAVFNTNGQIIGEVLNEFQDAGMHKILFNTTDLTPGTYYYKINCRCNTEYTMTGSMIKSK
jgi:hypothetical protein